MPSAEWSGGMQYQIQQPAEYSACLLASPQSQCVTVVMNRSEFLQVFDFVNDFISNQCSLGEQFCTLYDTVTNSRYFIHAGNDRSITSGQSLYQPFKCFRMGREIAVFLYFSAIRSLVTQMTINADSVAVSFCDYRFIFHINQLIFQRGAASIYNENNHKKIQSFLMMPVLEHRSFPDSFSIIHKSLWNDAGESRSPPQWISIKKSTATVIDRHPFLL